MQKSLFYLFIFLTQFIFSQQKGTIEGHVLSNGEPIPYANVLIKNTTIGTTTDEKGLYSLKAEPGKTVVVVQTIGYKTAEKTITVKENSKNHLDFTIEESVFGLNQVVVSATRGLQKRTEAPTIVTVTGAEVLQKAQAMSLSEGLSFQPGLRMETNCQNCGYSSVRMNGLDGAYSQILLDSRPIFSALNGVYGLDQIPANMIERIEVVRGGGSSLYGSNAIAGTINIITKEPIKNQFEVNSHLGLINGNVPDKVLSLNATVLNDASNMGIQVFGMVRNREAFDANGDNFSESTLMENKTFGFKSFYRPKERTKLTFEFHNINEFRRGGEMTFNLLPYESYTTEQITSKAVGGGITFENFSADEKNKYAVYFNTQQSKNDNFYGGRTDDILGNIDLAESLRGFGNTEVVTYVTGAQYNRKQEKFLGGSGSFIAGAEYKNEKMVDEKPGYNAFVNQTLNIMGIYAQEEWKATEKWKFLLGLRADFHDATDEDVIFNPRVNIMYNILDNLQWRTSYAKGFRAPQVFSEDIHARIAAGEVALVALDKNLKSETSHSYMTSLDFSKINERSEYAATFEMFYTQLINPFVLEQVEDLIWEKRNGPNANVYGINLEGKYAPGEKWQFQAGATFQKALYDKAVQWSENIANDNRNFFKSPNVYGNFMITYSPKKAFQNNLTMVYTGSMFAPHFEGTISQDRLETTRSFTELNWKSSYTFVLQNDFDIQLNVGVQNILNQYQKDFDNGINRDASYIYGPSRPITFFVGLKIGSNLL
jgi:outer membrane receptor for ferrienterochelin and colicins